MGGGLQAPDGLLPFFPQGSPGQKGTIMGTLRSLGALARAVGPLVAASGEGPRVARPGRGPHYPSGRPTLLPSWGRGAAGTGWACVTAQAVSPQCTGWQGPGSASPCALASSCSPSCSCGT